jgi:hypothetical protein
MPSARYVHPEFGYLCPTPRLRRNMRVAIACMVLGAIGVAMLRAGPDFGSAHSPASGSAAMMTRIDGGASGLEAAQGSEAAALGLRPAVSQGAKTCEQDTWADLDGKCAAGKDRKPRMVRVPANRPAIAAIPLGRVAAPVAGTAEPAAGVVATADGRKGDFSPSKPEQSALAEAPVAAATVATEPPQQPVAARKKPHRTAHSQNRRRDRIDPAPAYGYASVPDQRYGSYGGGFFFFR